jgi:hypothetical protein
MYLQLLIAKLHKETVALTQDNKILQNKLQTLLEESALFIQINDIKSSCPPAANSYGDLNILQANLNSSYNSLVCTLQSILNKAEIHMLEEEGNIVVGKQDFIKSYLHQ